MKLRRAGELEALEGGWGMEGYTIWLESLSNVSTVCDMRPSPKQEQVMLGAKSRVNAPRISTGFIARLLCWTADYNSAGDKSSVGCDVSSSAHRLPP